MVYFKTFPQRVLLKVIKFYQKNISPRLGPRCRFYPTCSDYAHTCLEKYPLSQALLKIIGRIFRCQPWHPGGFDYP